MKFIYSLPNRKYSSTSLQKINDITPDIICFSQEGDEYTAEISLTSSSSEEQAQYLLYRELNRLFFLTGISTAAIFKCVVDENGNKFSQGSLDTSWGIKNSIPKTIKVQKWSTSLATQLELWRVAESDKIPLHLKINVFFQIIELSNINNNHKTKYQDSSKTPDPNTECRLLRNLVSHQGVVNSGELKKYCDYIGYPHTFFDPADKEFYNFIRSKLNLVREEARKIVNRAIPI